MSILIKGLNMPREDDYLPLNIYKDGRVAINFNAYATTAEQLPPHGRLIDADALIVDLMDRGVEGLQTDDWYEIQQSVVDAPTVIEAEESEDKE